MGHGEGREPGRIDGRRVYDGRVFDVHLDRVRFPDGSEGELEMVRPPAAAAVVPVDERGELSGDGQVAVRLIRQYRYAAEDFIWEVPAGKLDPGEEPVECAHRELEEEAGVRAGSLRRMTTIYTTPGFTDETIHLFLATDLRPGRTAHESSEFIECRTLPFPEVLEMVRCGEIVDGKSICALLYAAQFTGAAGGGDGGREGRTGQR